MSTSAKLGLEGTEGEEEVDIAEGWGAANIETWQRDRARANNVRKALHPQTPSSTMTVGLARTDVPSEPIAWQSGVRGGNRQRRRLASLDDDLRPPGMGREAPAVGKQRASNLAPTREVRLSSRQGGVATGPRFEAARAAPFFFCFHHHVRA